jgi:DNA-directed RNA polymerase alpha subunit
MMPSVAQRKAIKKAAAIRRFQATQMAADMEAAARPKLSDIVDQRLPPAETPKVVPIRTLPILTRGVETLISVGLTKGMVEDLKANGIATLEDLKGKSDEDILRLEGFGPGRMARIKLAYKELGIE